MPCDLASPTCSFNKGWCETCEFSYQVACWKARHSQCVALGYAPDPSYPVPTQATYTLERLKCENGQLLVLISAAQRLAQPRMLVQAMAGPVVTQVQHPLIPDEELRDPFTYLHPPADSPSRRQCWQCMLSLPSSCFYMSGETCRHCAEHGSGF
eukprot:CAMPEP_0172175136 /NCGR_PEP_ID=MMETSP1050-20130122/14050_1 /TAXON_ID=233186 /ORGANISM="Cryptomonas curvata, Strain CCAP979/52" /LENGTH=153 /DNA_ID=CAMNT_0012847185 /DNA_START=246 /DNA_END=707 /DNA_ORIENTATION=+